VKSVPAALALSTQLRSAGSCVASSALTGAIARAAGGQARAAQPLRTPRWAR
jgi:hypothetical protein